MHSQALTVRQRHTPIATSPAFLEINGESILADDALRQFWIEKLDFAAPIIEQVLLRQYAVRNDIRILDKELQVAADEMRYARELEVLDDFHLWMRTRHQTPESLEAWLEDKLLRQRLLERFTSDEISAYYAEHRLDFERILLSSCRLESLDKAAEILQLLKEGESFIKIASAHSTDNATKRFGGDVGLLTRSGVEPEIESVLFGAKAGCLIGPVKTAEGFNIFLVHEIERPTLKERETEIREALLAELISRLIAIASIQYPLFGG